MNPTHQPQKLDDAARPLVPQRQRDARHRVLYFMRSIDCPICRNHVKRLAALEPALRAAGVEVVVFAPAVPGQPVPAWTGEQPFAVVIGDAVHGAAGLGRGLFGAIQKSGTLVVDAAWNVVHTRQATLPFQAFDERELLGVLGLSGSARALGETVGSSPA